MEAQTPLDNSVSSDAFVTFYPDQPKQIVQDGAEGLGEERKDGSSKNLNGH